jgi:hypothetical protein
MKTTKYIASFMYFMVLLCFIFSGIYFIHGISSKIFFKDEINSTFIKSNNKYSRISGNLVPVNLKLTIPDTITAYKRYSSMRYSCYPLEPKGKFKKIKNYKDILVVNKYISNKSPFFRNEESAVITSIKYNGSTKDPSLIINTDSSFINYLLLFRGFLTHLFWIFELYFLMKIIKELAKDIYFSKILLRNISKLGYIILISQIIPLIYAYIDTNLFWSIETTPRVMENLKETYIENISVAFFPKFDFNFYILFLGAVLVLFTKLVERGRALEEESELTI